MFQYIRAVVLICIVHYSTGYEWISLKPGDRIPDNAIPLQEINDNERDNRFVGRARYYNSILPAEVYNSTYAVLSMCYKQIIRTQGLEVLVASESCEWKSFNYNQELTENSVRAGSSSSGEPIFVGKMGDCHSNNYRIGSIYLSTNKLEWWNECLDYTRIYFLRCDDNSKWVETSANKIPTNAIFGGKSRDNEDIFVARLLNGCDFVAAQVIPELGISSAVSEDKSIKAMYCGVLVGDPNEYNWIPACCGEIPDYAVVVGKSKRGEFRYIAKYNRTIGYIEHMMAWDNEMEYEVLVKNVGYIENIVVDI